MSDKYPLFPALSSDGQEEAQKIIDDFKNQMEKIASQTLGKLYTDVVLYIETDSWTNFRNEIMDGFKNYGNRKIQARYAFKEIRQAILKEYRDEIIDDLNQDMVEEIANLKKTIDMLRDQRAIY